MTKPLRIAFVWDWEIVPSQAIGWQDGLAAAIKELGNRGHDIRVFACGSYEWVLENVYFPIYVHETGDKIVRAIAEYEPDVILHWADLTRPNARATARLGKPMAICFAGGETMGGNLPYFAHFFVESDVYYKSFEDYNRSVSTAFGTNTELFKPLPEQPKLFDTIFPATFARWKRHELYAKSVEGLRSLAMGYMYDTHEQECWQVCLDHGTTIMPHVSAETLRYLYAASKVCVIPSLSSGGSQRTVLEAMAMNLPLVVCDSDKFDYVEGQEVLRVAPEIPAIRDAVEKMLENKVNTRDYILQRWSEYSYADAIEQGLYALL